MANLTILPPNEQANISDDAFAEAYHLLRQKEGRVVDDGLLRLLPKVKKSHPHYQEWRIRALSAQRLIQHLQEQPGVLDILEVGCGNGWLAAQLAANPAWRVTGIDLNKPELEQAQRVFGHIPNLQFAQGNLGEGVVAGKTFDIILFAASVQYFASLQSVIAKALTYSSIRGEIHIIDTMFYPMAQLVAARQRSVDYYTQQGCPILANRYFHHSLQALDGFQHKILHKPALIWQGLGFVRYPFYHIQIKNHCL